MTKIISPIYITLPRKTKADKKYSLNLNQYRNWHYAISNNIKKAYYEIIKDQIKDLKFNKPVSIGFDLYKGSKRKIDRSNILSIVEKFFCDSLVEAGAIPDDNDSYIKGTLYSTAGIDRDNPRCEIFIYE